MKLILRNIVDIAIYLILFILLQVLSCLLFNRICTDSTLSTILGLGVSAVLTILTFHFLRFSPLGCGYVRTRPYALLAWMALLALCLLLPSQFLEELISADMPDQTIAVLGAVMSRPLGFLVVGILAPIAEEMVFRGAVLRTLLTSVCNPWLAIVVSAVLFGAIHGNVPQFLHAMLVGLLLGWAYFRTKSILPGLVVHWVNNSVAFLLCFLCPESLDASLPEYFSGNLPLMYSCIAVSSFVAVFSLWRAVKTVG